jgi:hypothetical protein
MSGYDWSQFHVHMYYLAPLDEVFRRREAAGTSLARNAGRYFVVTCSHLATTCFLSADRAATSASPSGAATRKAGGVSKS